MHAARALTFLETPDHVAIGSRRCVLDAWRATKTVVHFDPDLAEALWNSVIDFKSPPGYPGRTLGCVYIATPGRLAFDQPLHGFFVSGRGDCFDFILDGKTGPWSVSISPGPGLQIHDIATFLIPYMSFAFFMCTANIVHVTTSEPDHPTEVRARYDGDLPKRGLWQVTEDGRCMRWVDRTA